MIDRFSVVGVNHKTANISLREHFVSKLGGTEEAFLQNLKKNAPKFEIVPLFTCNRVELYTAGTNCSEQPAYDQFCSIMPGPEAMGALYHMKGEEAIRHLVRLGVGLDSMVVGEPQIFSQMKKAYETSRKHGMTGHTLNKIFQQSFDIIKEIRSRSILAGIINSVPAAAIAVARSVFSEFRSKHVILVGTGEMGLLVNKLLTARGCSNITILSRSDERVKEFVEKGFNAKPISEISDEVVKCDILITCTRTEGFVLTREQLAKRLKQTGYRPLLALDLGVPRNIAPDVATVENVFLWNVDMLESIVRREREQAKDRISVAEELVGIKCRQMILEFKESSVGDVVKILNEFRSSLIEEIRKETNDANLTKDNLEKIIDRILKSQFHFSVRIARALRRAGMTESDIAKIFAESLHGRRDRETM